MDGWILPVAGPFVRVNHPEGPMGHTRPKGRSRKTNPTGLYKGQETLNGQSNWDPEKGIL